MDYSVYLIYKLNEIGNVLPALNAEWLTALNVMELCFFGAIH
jgi:hypothetical protein